MDVKFCGGTFAVKYEVKLDDGTVVAKTPENGVEFYVKDGMSRCVLNVRVNDLLLNYCCRITILELR